MKVDPSKILPNMPQVTELPSKPPAGAKPQMSEIKENKTTIEGARKEALSAKGNMDLAAKITQSNLQKIGKENLGTNISKEEIIESARKLKPFLRDLIRKSQNDPDKLLEGIREQVDPHNLGSFGDGDILAMAFIVMMEASKSAQEDLKSIMDQVKNINSAKQKFRSLMSQLRTKPDSSKDDSDDP